MDDRIERLRAVAAELERAQAEVRRLLSEREALVRSLATDGRGAAELGRAAGLTRGRIYQITQGADRAPGDAA